MNNRTQLLDRLWECQDAHRCIREEDIVKLSEEFGLSQVDVKGVASFYHFFHFEPAGKYTIYLNTSIISKQAGYHGVRSALEEATGVKWGHTSPMGTFGLFDTPCIGLSDQEPAALINFHPFTRLSPSRIRRIVGQLKRGTPPEKICDEVKEEICYTPDPKKTIFFREHVPGRALTALSEKTPEAIISEIQDSGLSGRGGAFFPTGLKWDLCRKNPGPRYLVCNADEGEPGTFKDRALMNKLPELMIEGMIAAGYAIGAEEGFIYLRAEYRWLLPKLEKAIDQYRDMGWLGKDIQAKESFNFDIRIQLGAGSYVCGEETALLESMEGKRGEPRTKQFYPVERGYLGQPTVVNNVETLCAAARVLELGASFFNNMGTQATSGTKILSIAGDCSRPGIYEIEWGMRLGELMALCGASDPYYIQVSGPSGQVVNKSDLNREISFEDLTCGGSVMMFGKNRDILRLLRNFNDFFRQESCGMCTPCRAGNFIVSRKLEKLHHCLGGPDDLSDLRNWGQMMKLSSRCGLGQTAPNSILFALDKFPEYFHDLISQQNATQGIDLEQAIADYQFATKNNGTSYER